MMKEEDYGSFYTKDEGEQGQPQVPGKEDCLPTYKVVILGDSEVGKSAIMVRYTDDVFNSSQMSTIGADLRRKKVKVGDEEVTLQLWDTAGQERFRSITSSYFKEMDGIIMVYSVTARNTYQSTLKKLYTAYKHLPFIYIKKNKFTQ